MLPFQHQSCLLHKVTPSPHIHLGQFLQVLSVVPVYCSNISGSVPTLGKRDHPHFDNLIKEITESECAVARAYLLLLSAQFASPVQGMHLQRESFSKISQKETLERTFPCCAFNNSLMCELRFFSYSSEICAIWPNEVCSLMTEFQTFASKSKGIRAP